MGRQTCRNSTHNLSSRSKPVRKAKLSKKGQPTRETAGKTRRQLLLSVLGASSSSSSSSSQDSDVHSRSQSLASNSTHHTRRTKRSVSCCQSCGPKTEQFPSGAFAGRRQCEGGLPLLPFRRPASPTMKACSTNQQHNKRKNAKNRPCLGVLGQWARAEQAPVACRQRLTDWPRARRAPPQPP
ncbi:unnamed protein product, partial [Ixodes pacificus]